MNKILSILRSALPIIRAALKTKTVRIIITGAVLFAVKRLGLLSSLDAAIAAMPAIGTLGITDAATAIDAVLLYLAAHGTLFANETLGQLKAAAFPNRFYVDDETPVAWQQVGFEDGENHWIQLPVAFYEIDKARHVYAQSQDGHRAAVNAHADIEPLTSWMRGKGGKA